MIMKCALLAIWTLSSSANEENPQDYEGRSMSTSTSLYYPSTVGKEFTCLDVKPQTFQNKDTKRKCEKACRKEGVECSGYHFDRYEKMCTLYSATLQGSSSIKYCAKTAAVLSTIHKFSCAVGVTLSPTGTDTWRKCKRKCKIKKCYSFEYDTEEKKCDLFTFRDAKRWDIRDGVRCDKKSSIMSFLKCPCFSSDEVDNAVSALKQGTATSSQQKTSCQITSGGSYGLYYKYNLQHQRMINSLSVNDGLNELGTCEKNNDIERIAIEERDVCATLLEGACDTLDENFQETCPCYDDDKLADAVTSINNGTNELVEGSCISHNNASIYFYYKEANTLGFMVEGYSVHVSNFTSSNSCTHGGDMKIPSISAESALQCFNIIQNACQ